MAFFGLFGNNNNLPAPAAPATDEEKSVTMPPDFWNLFANGWGMPTKSGTPASTYTALQIPTFYAAARVIAEGIAQLPVEIYRRSTKGSEPAVDHPMYDLLRYKPSELQDAFQFWSTVLIHAAASGNSVSQKVMVGGQVRELIPIRPENTGIDLYPNTYERRYTVSLENGHSATLGASDVFHVSGPCWYAYRGLDPAEIGREAIGLARATEESQARLHSNGVRPSGILTTDQRLDKSQLEMLREQMNTAYTGVSNAMKTLILSGGLKWTQTAMTGVDSQHLETRKHQIEEICRVMGVFPIMVGHAGDQSPTFASAEAFFDAHVRYTLQRWITAIKFAVETQLLTTEERRAGYFVRVDTSEYTRGSLDARTRYYQAGLGTNSNPGWLTPNEVREDDGWNPMPDLDKVMSPLTMTPADQNTGGDASHTDAAQDSADDEAEDATETEDPASEDTAD